MEVLSPLPCRPPSLPALSRAVCVQVAPDEDQEAPLVYLTVNADEIRGTIKPLVHNPPEYASWKDARRAAWDELALSPDAYYFAYLSPGERAESGPWQSAEASRFERLLEEHTEKVGAGAWGLLSLHMTGRTGGQCKLRYEKIKKAGYSSPGRARGRARRRVLERHVKRGPVLDSATAAASTEPPAELQASQPPHQLDLSRPLTAPTPDLPPPVPSPATGQFAGATGGPSRGDSPVPSLVYTPRVGDSIGASPLVPRGARLPGKAVLGAHATGAVKRKADELGSASPSQSISTHNN